MRERESERAREREREGGQTDRQTENFLVASQPEAWCYGVSAITGWPKVSIL